MTHAISEAEAAARCEAGRDAVDICFRYDGETASEILAGRMVAYVIACSQVFGWDRTLALIGEIRGATNLIDFPRGSA